MSQLLAVGQTEAPRLSFALTTVAYLYNRPHRRPLFKKVINELTRINECALYAYVSQASDTSKFWWIAVGDPNEARLAIII